MFKFILNNAFPFGQKNEENAFHEEINFLKQNSNLAKDIIRSLEGSGFLVYISANQTLLNQYRSPEEFGEYSKMSFSSYATGGIVLWNMAMALITFDLYKKEKNIKSEKLRPDYKWANKGQKDYTFFGYKCYTTKKNKIGILPTSIALLHELSHAYQYIINPIEYLNCPKSEIEQLVVDSIETPAILELREKGYTHFYGHEIVPRWDYNSVAAMISIEKLEDLKNLNEYWL